MKRSKRMHLSVLSGGASVAMREITRTRPAPAQSQLALKRALLGPGYPPLSLWMFLRLVFAVGVDAATRIAVDPWHPARDRNPAASQLRHEARKAWLRSMRARRGGA